MKETLKFSQLSTSRKALVQFCQTINYGSIFDLRVVSGEVICDPPPSVLVDVRLDEELVGRTELELTDFLLCVELRRPFRALDSIENGMIDKIVVHAGIPRRVTIRRPLWEIVQIVSEET